MSQRPAGTHLIQYAVDDYLCAEVGRQGVPDLSQLVGFFSGADSPCLQNGQWLVFGRPLKSQREIVVLPVDGGQFVRARAMLQPLVLPKRKGSRENGEQKAPTSRYSHVPSKSLAIKRVFYNFAFLSTWANKLLSIRLASVEHWCR